MKKCDVVKYSRDFDEIIKKGRYIKNNEFVIYYIVNNLDKNRYGISVGKKIGNAVTRNYYKRILRNICDKSKLIYSKSRDYIIIMRNGCIELSFKEIEDSLLNLMEKIDKKAREYEKTN